MEGYKVLSRVDGQLLSPLAPDAAKLKYSPTCTTKRASKVRHGPLALSKRLEDAQQFKRDFVISGGAWEIWPCDFEPSDDTNSWFVASPTKTYKDLSQFEGMIFADSITLGAKNAT